ncbi:SUMF1/EgtB/PvdO family nonheme iron enzyme, partial [Nitrosomonas sp.]|uniref:formylglycine-generating enzyme family protein n=1 Tax=Nitrosomonas sp. TaxID=42353 RepID=UPI002840D291
LIAQLARADPDRWREVVILSGGIHALPDPGPVWVLLKALTDREDTETLTEPDAWGLRLAGEILAESVALSDLNPKRQKIFNRIQHILPEALTTPHLAARERVDIGCFLGKIGDPRAAVTDVDAMPFCHVPAGPFFMGKGAYDNENEVWLLVEETPAGEYDLKYDYWIAQYPVTVAQFQMFVDDSGFELGDTDALKAGSNTPVVWVSQQEALAFCDWLTRRWQQAGVLPEGWRVTLPNEPEWEKAARGGLDIPATPLVNSIATIAFEKPVARPVMKSNHESQRRYPWGNLIDDSYANYQMNVGGVSTPGIYFGSISPYGCHDLAGNVWEWTRSERGDYPYPAIGTHEYQQRENGNPVVCVLRGGAFDGYRSRVRCAVRHGGRPVDRDDDVGFRVVLSPCR